ncbi:MAG: tetratricopeptide repeat protein [Endomicrobiaceae bacterium]|nr:tetratricopeptide repeat protein [Endomicrobiaceae bacterium]
MRTIKNFLGTNLAFLIILTAIVFAVYGKTINYEFTNHDDSVLITRNINFITELKNIPKLFITSCYYSGDFPYYRPTLTLSFAIESIIFGNNTKVYHLSNIILFILSIYLMYIFLTQLRQNSTILKFICLLIAVHPMFSSTVAWIPARNDTLLIIFICLSFINLINYLNYRKNTNILLFFLFYSLSLFTKETALILIPMYVFFIYIFKIKITKKQIIKLIMVLFPITICYFCLRNIAVSNSNIDILGWQQYGSTILIGTMTYVSKFLIPDHISIIMYDLNIGQKTLILSIILFVFLFVSLKKKLISPRTILFGFVWLVIWLFPTFLLSDYVLVFHRFLISSIGITLIFCEFTNNVIIKYTVSKKYFIVVFVILFGTYSYAAYIQADKYKDSDTYWINAYYDAPNYHATCYFISRIYLKNNDYKKAKEFIYKAIQYSNNSPLYSSDLALIYAYEGNYNNAEKEYLKSIEANINVASSCRNLSGIYLYQNDVQNAYLYAKKAFNLEPYNIDFSIYMAKIYKLSNEYKSAIDIYLNLLKHDKKNAQYYYTIGTLYESLKDYKNAVKYIDEGLKLAPENIALVEKLKFLKEQKHDFI